jgi:manganese transport protein
MGAFANTRLVSVSAWALFVVISAANIWLVAQFFGLA